MPQPNKPGPGRLIVGGALFVIGVLVLIPSGLCSTFLIFSGVSGLISNPQGVWNDIRDFGPILLIGPVVAIVAILMIKAGLAIRRRE